jgi:hypothetical protein
MQAQCTRELRGEVTVTIERARAVEQARMSSEEGVGGCCQTSRGGREEGKEESQA